MGYRLGVDLGTTFTAAAVVRPGASPEVVPLGSRSATVPTVLFLGADGALLVGEAAERRSVTDPDRVVRQFKRRIGDETPLVVGGAEHLAHDLAATLIWWVVARATEREGAAPEAIAVTHPATWGPHKKDLLRAALAAKDLPAVTLVTEPEAAAISYAHTGRIAQNATLAVYDLGGGTFDAALLRTTPDGRFTALGRPHGLPDLGGIDFDDAILAHVLGAIGAGGLDTPARAVLAEGGFVRLPDMTDPLVVTAMARLRRECVDAKEALSSDTSATIPVLLADVRTNIRLTRAELEAMITPAVLRTIEVLDATLASADVAPEDLTNVLLTGGSSRIPIVAQLLSRHLGAPVSLDRDIDPKMAVAMGAALALAGTAVRAAAASTAASTAAAAAAMLPPVKAAEANVRAVSPEPVAAPTPAPVLKPVPVKSVPIKRAPAPRIKSTGAPKPKVTEKATAPGSAAAAVSAAGVAAAAAVASTAAAAAATAASEAPAVASTPAAVAASGSPAAVPPASVPPTMPARPASSTAYLAGEDAALPSARSKLGPRRALTLLGLTTVLMLGSGVGLNAFLNSSDATRQTSVAPVEPAKTQIDTAAADAKKSDAKAKKKAKSSASSSSSSWTPAQSGGSAATSSSDATSAAPSASTAGSGSSAPASTTTTTTTTGGSSTTAEQAAAKRKAAAKKKTGSKSDGTSFGTGTDPAAWDTVDNTADTPAAPSTGSGQSDTGSGTGSTPTDPGSGTGSGTPSDPGSGDSKPPETSGGSDPGSAPAKTTAEPPSSGFTQTAPPDGP